MRNIKKLRLVNKLFPCPELNGLKIKITILKFTNISTFVKYKYGKTNMLHTDIMKHVVNWANIVCVFTNIPRDKIYFIHHD